MAKKKTSSKAGKKKVGKKRGPKVTKVIKTDKLTLAQKIFAEKIQDMTLRNVEIAKKVGCHESTVRMHLKGKLKGQIEDFFREKFRNEIFSLQTKAFKRLNDMLDDKSTPAHTVATVCRFLLEKFILTAGEGEDSEGTETLEFETVISDNGTMQQIKRKVYEKKKIQKDTEVTDDYGKWAEDQNTIDV